MRSDKKGKHPESYAMCQPCHLGGAIDCGRSQTSTGKTQHCLDYRKEEICDPPLTVRDFVIRSHLMSPLVVSVTDATRLTAPILAQFFAKHAPHSTEPKPHSLAALVSDVFVNDKHSISPRALDSSLSAIRIPSAFLIQPSILVLPNSKISTSQAYQKGWSYSVSV